MTAVSNTPTNRNFLAPTKFTFRIKKTPNVNFFVQRANVPSIYDPNVDIKNEHVVAPYPGEHLIYEPLELEFLVDENLENYLEIHNWLVGLGKPQSYQQYKDLSSIPLYTGEGLFSDVSLFIMNSLYAPNFEIVFTDAFPIKLSGMQFKTTDEDIVFTTASVTFKYTYYTIESI